MPISIQAGTGLSITPLFPYNQDPAISDYFSLNVTAGEEQQISIRVYNNSSEALDASISLFSVGTAESGRVNYRMAGQRDSNTSLAFTDVAPQTQRNITIPAGHNEEIQILISIPSEGFDGIILGSIYILATESTTSERRFSQTIPVKLYENNRSVEANFLLGNVSIDHTNNSLTIEIRHPQPRLTLDTEVGLKIYQLGTNRLLFSTTDITVDFAPNSIFNLRLTDIELSELQGTDRLEDDHLMVISVEYQNRTWYFEYQFTAEPMDYAVAEVDYEEPQARLLEIGQVDEITQAIPFLLFDVIPLWLLICVSVAIFVIVIVLILYRLYLNHFNSDINPSTNKKVKRIGINKLPEDLTGHRTIIRINDELFKLRNKIEELSAKNQNLPPMMSLPSEAPLSKKPDILTELNRMIVAGFIATDDLKSDHELANFAANGGMDTQFERGVVATPLLLVGDSKNSISGTVRIYPVCSNLTRKTFVSNGLCQLFGIELKSETSKVIIKKLIEPPVLAGVKDSHDTFKVSQIGEIEYEEKPLYAEALEELETGLASRFVDRQMLSEKYNLISLEGKDNFASTMDASQDVLFKKRGNYRLAAMSLDALDEMLYVFPLCEDISRNEYYTFGFHLLFAMIIKGAIHKVEVVKVISPAILVRSKESPDFYEIQKPGEIKLRASKLD